MLVHRCIGRGAVFAGTVRSILVDGSGPGESHLQCFCLKLLHQEPLLQQLVPAKYPFLHILWVLLILQNPTNATTSLPKIGTL